MSRKVKTAVAAIIILAALICLAAEACVYGCAAYVVGTALAEDGTDCWVMCQPGDYINIRSGPGKRYEATGYAESGMRFTTDMKERNGFMHIVGVTENGDGWISSGYIVYAEPEEIGAEMTVRSNGRVACRKTIDGKRREWARNGDRVMVYAKTRSVAVTNKGFIECKYLEAGK